MMTSSARRISDCSEEYSESCFSTARFCLVRRPCRRCAAVCVFSRWLESVFVASVQRVCSFPRGMEASSAFRAAENADSARDEDCNSRLRVCLWVCSSWMASLSFSFAFPSLMHWIRSCLTAFRSSRSNASIASFSFSSFSHSLFRFFRGNSSLCLASDSSAFSTLRWSDSSCSFNACNCCFRVKASFNRSVGRQRRMQSSCDAESDRAGWKEFCR